LSLNYTIGDLFLQGLDDYGISSQTIREGVLTAKKFSKIEHDEGLGDRMIWDFLLERMSVSPLIYKCYITKDEETLLQKRKVLRSITDELRSIPLNATQQQLEKQNNLMLSVEWEEGAVESCRLLREHRLLYSVHHQYSAEQVPSLLDGSWLEQVLPAHPAFALLLAQHGCPNVQQQEVYQYVLSVRDGQKYPLILMDIKNDLLMIDNIISSDVCLAGFDRDGTLYSHNATYRLYRIANRNGIVQLLNCLLALFIGKHGKNYKRDDQQNDNYNQNNLLSGHCAHKK